MGSNNLAVVNGALGRTGLVEVGEGPTGVRYDAAHDRVYVLNKFEGAVSVVNAAQLVEMDRVEYYDPTPGAIKAGRPFLYDTHRTSGLGQASCASCHVDGRMDQLSWDLGDPQGAVKPFNQACQNPGVGCDDWHPMKGPLVTQTLVGIIGTEPFHWRGDREDLAAFNGAFEGLLGDDVQLTDEEMDQFEAFVATLTPPPNPFRKLDGTLPRALFNGGNPVAGESAFALCASCHAFPSGTSGAVMAAEMNGGNSAPGAQSIKIPQLRNLYEKTGFDRASPASSRGFGFLHDGGTDTLLEFLGNFPFGPKMMLDLEAFLLCFATDTHAGVGAQATLPHDPAAPGGPSVEDLIGLASAGSAGLVAKGLVGGEARGYYLSAPGSFQSDRASERIAVKSLLALAELGAEITLTAVPAGSALRIGVDRDEDGHFDRDEIDAGSDPADPASTPALAGDLDGDGHVGITDFLALLQAWGPCPGGRPGCPGDLDGDGRVGPPDFQALLANWG
jgi:hypothetical protein